MKRKNARYDAGSAGRALVREDERDAIQGACTVSQSQCASGREICRDRAGHPGNTAAFAAEFIISFILMATLRILYHHDTLKGWVGYAAGFLLLVYITFESPFSGMSLNPARSIASAIPARSWKAIWIYFTAPSLAMLLAVILFQ